MVSRVALSLQAEFKKRNMNIVEEKPGYSIGLTSLEFRLLLTAVPLVMASIWAVIIIRSETPKFLIISGKSHSAYLLIQKMAMINKSPTVDEPDFPTSVASMARRPCERGTLEEIQKINITKPLLAQWTIQAIVYWGAMTALPRLYKIWIPATQAAPFHVEVLLLLYFFELVGIVLAAITSLKFGAMKTVVWFTRAGTALVITTTVSLALNAAWFLAASVCGMFACLTPLWGILFVITTESFPIQIRATALGIMMSTSICQGILELGLPGELDAGSWIPTMYSGIAALISGVGIYIAQRYMCHSESSLHIQDPQATLLR
jgi:hypothetical protein